MRQYLGWVSVIVEPVDHRHRRILGECCDLLSTVETSHDHVDVPKVRQMVAE